MKELLKSVEALTAEELARSYKKFPKFNGPHEGYAVILEEAEEAHNELVGINQGLMQMWACVKCNSETSVYAECIKKSATNLAAEAIQVAAMAQKYIDSLGNDTP